LFQPFYSLCGLKVHEVIVGMRRLLRSSRSRMTFAHRSHASVLG
jgi:hypothetical protein